MIIDAGGIDDCGKKGMYGMAVEVVKFLDFIETTSKYPGIRQSEMCRHEPRKETTTCHISTFGGAGWQLRAGGRPRSHQEGS